MTVYAEYSNATNVNNFISTIKPYLTMDVEEFRTNYFDLYTCNAQGLDNWGRILDISRDVSNDTKYNQRFGFGQISNPPPTGQYPQNFNNGSFYNGQGSGVSTVLTDTEFRELLKLRYRTLTTNQSIGSINIIMNEYVRAQNITYRALVVETSPMLLTYNYNFTLLPYQRTIFTKRNVIPVPLGVGFINQENQVI
jgi:hypothetical protein